MYIKLRKHTTVDGITIIKRVHCFILENGSLVALWHEFREGTQQEMSVCEGLSFMS